MALQDVRKRKRPHDDYDDGSILSINPNDDRGNGHGHNANRSHRGRKIIVGIDFGTTYSGIAWAETYQPDRRSAITTWPINLAHREGESSDKVPTKLRYRKPTTGDTGEVNIQWGFAVPVSASQDEVIEWFKLELDTSANTHQYGKTQKPNMGGREAVELASDYIRGLSDHLKYILRRKLGDGVVNSMPIEFVVTVPAMWTDLAKDKTQIACMKALENFGDNKIVQLVSEPEAAAIFSLHGLDPHGLEVDDTIVVVDAGGGTVDLISYTISQLEPSLELVEAAPGAGGLCGSSFLNKGFEELLQKKFARKKAFDAELLAEALDVFERKVKRQFTLAEGCDETYLIPVGGIPNSKEPSVRNGRLSLKKSEVEAIFEPVVLEIIQLVKDQLSSIRKKIRAILLVGGFGASVYLRERIHSALDGKVEIMQPPNAWQAVVQGAVMKGLMKSDPAGLLGVRVTTRKARKSYGVNLSVNFLEHEHAHLGGKEYWDPMNGGYRISFMHWFIKRDQGISESQPVTIRYHDYFLLERGHPGKVKSTVIYCDRAQRDLSGPVIQKDNQMQHVSNLIADLSSIPESDLPRKKMHDGRWYYDLDLRIDAIFLSASTAYSFWFGDKRYDTITCEYV